jgi:DivIVA domain-containing protein
LITLLAILGVLAVVFGVAVVLTGRAEVLSDESPDRAATGIPRDRAMTPEDVIGLRFALAFRGYRMDEVDDALDRLAAEIAARDEAIHRLRAGAAAQAAPAAAYVPSDASGDVPSGTPVEQPGEPWPSPPEVAVTEPAYVPSDATGEVAPGTPVDVPPAPDAGEPDGVEPEFREPEPAPPAPEPPAAPSVPEPPAVRPVPEWTPPAPEPPAAPVVPEPAPGFAPEPPSPPSPPTPPEPPEPPEPPSPYRPEVPDIPTYDPWSVTPRSRYTDGPTYLEVEQHDDAGVAEAVTEHHTGYAPPPPAAPDDDTE